MDNVFDVIVVGIGAMGASACLHLARRGVRVLGLEQFDIPNALGSSHGSSRIIRQAYYEHPDYVPLLLRSYELWQELEAISGTKVMHLTGGLYIGPADCELVTHSQLAAQQHHLDHEMLDSAQIMARFPQFKIPSDFIGLFEPRAGFLIPEKAVETMARVAITSGAEIHPREPVREWKTDSTSASVTTDLATYRADQVIFCSGAWTSRLLADLNVTLKVTRQPMSWFRPSDPASFALDRFPIWAMHRPAGGIYYGFPMSADDIEIKAAVHFPGEVVSPDSVDRNPRPGDSTEISDTLRTHLPSAHGPIFSEKICLYTNSPDSHFIIDRHPAHPRVTIACGFSGHGFKFASVVGEILADLAMKGSTGLPAQFLGLARFNRK